MDKMRFADWLMVILLVAAPFAVWVTDQTYLYSPLISVAVLGLAALALNVLLGLAGFVSLGHAAFFAVGGYIVGIGSFHHFEETLTPFGTAGWNDLAVSLPLAFVFGFLLAVLFGVFSLRARAAYFIMATLALAQMLFFFFTALEGYGGDDGLSLWWKEPAFAGFALDDKFAYTLFCIAILLGFLWLFVALANAPFGWVLQGGRENEDRMQALGFRLYPYHLVAFGLSGGVAALAGALRVDSTGFMSPELAHWSLSGELLIILIFGGLRRPTSALWGAAALVALEYFGSSFSPYWRLGLGLILLIVVLVGKQGLGGLVQSLFELVVRKPAKKAATS